MVPDLTGAIDPRNAQCTSDPAGRDAHRQPVRKRVQTRARQTESSSRAMDAAGSELVAHEAELRRLRKIARARSVPSESRLVSSLLASNDRQLAEARNGNAGGAHIHEDPISVSSLGSLAVSRETRSSYNGPETVLTVNGSVKETNTESLLFAFEVVITVVKDAPEAVAALGCRVSPWARAELDTAIARYCRERKATYLFHLLSEYGRITQMRRRTFRQLARRYLVSNALWLTSDAIHFAPRLGFRVVLCWPIVLIGDAVRSRPSIKVDHAGHPSLPSPVSHEAVFRRLLRRHGVLKATCMMHDILRFS